LCGKFQHHLHEIPNFIKFIEETLNVISCKFNVSVMCTSGSYILICKIKLYKHLRTVLANFTIQTEAFEGRYVSWFLPRASGLSYLIKYELHRSILNKIIVPHDTLFPCTGPKWTFTWILCLLTYFDRTFYMVLELYKHYHVQASFNNFVFPSPEMIAQTT